MLELPKIITIIISVSNPHITPSIKLAILHINVEDLSIKFRMIAIHNLHVVPVSKFNIAQYWKSTTPLELAEVIRDINHPCAHEHIFTI